ncbi:MAG: hypothetical protein GX660_24440 [Clostridiaceae bacterium]|nr:hypothetical protein [Clostridiaceae bacterium]
MKNCNEVKELISMYIDNELDEMDRKNVEKHVESCTECKNELEDLRKMVNFLGSFDEVDLPSDFKETLHEKLVNNKEKMQNRNRFLLISNNKYFRAVTSVAAVILIIFMARGLTNIKMQNTPLQLASGKANKSALNNENAENNVLFNGEGDVAYGRKFFSDNVQNSELAGGAVENKKADNELAKLKPEVSLFFKSDLEDNQEITAGDSGSGNEKALERSAASAKPPQNDQVVITSGAGLEEGVNAASTMTVVESTDIVIKSAGDGQELDKIKSIAALYEVELIPIEPEGSDNFVKSTDRGNIKLSFTVENQNYDKFINELKQNYSENILINDIPVDSNEPSSSDESLNISGKGISYNSDNKEKAVDIKGPEIPYSEELKARDKEYKTGIIVIE